MDPSPPAPVPARTLPTAGTLTFLFTDVEGSTPLWEQHEARMRTVTARHDSLLDAIITAHGGQRVKERGEGDAIFAVFSAPPAAVAAALAMQRAVQAEPWPVETPIRVRIGIHTGAAELRAGDYYGPVVNRCARIRSLGHGGQVLLSAAIAALVRDALPDGATLRSLGAHKLKGISEPEEVFQLCHPALPDLFPPLLSPQAPKHNLPLALTSMIGREAEQGAVLALLGQARLVTLTGSGGVGKTRLALAVAGELADQYVDGVWLVELAALAEDRLVAQTVLESLSIREEAGRPLLATLTDHLQQKHLLLVLDNCEHLVAACAQLVSTLLRACPGVHILATSREVLEVVGERRYRVPTLPVPDLAHLPPPERMAETAAVALFVARARERRPDFALTAHNAQVVAQVCWRLDGIPLAIELAAARAGSLAVEQIAGRLDDRFRLLTGGARDALPRQRTLRAALDWSYDLLGKPEQVLLERLAVFAGGWTLAAAEAVCAGRLGGSSPRGYPVAAGDQGEGVAHEEVLDLLDSLVNKSLVHAEERDGQEVRHRLLETVREYAREKLAVAGEEPLVRDRHLAWYAALAEEAEPQLVGPDQGRWLDRLEADHDNLRAALSWAREHAAAEEELRLAGALSRFWHTRGHISEGREWLEAALAGENPAPTASRMTPLLGSGDLAIVQADYARAVDLYEEALALGRTLEDRHSIARALNGLAQVAQLRGDYARAVDLYEEALALARELADRRAIADALGNLGRVAYQTGDYGRAAALHEEALSIRRQLGDKQGIAISVTNLGNAAYEVGDYERATALNEEALALRRDLGDKYGITVSLTNLGEIAHIQGDHGRALALHEEALALRRQLGYRRGIAYSLINLGHLAYDQGDYDRAATLLREGLLISQDIGARDFVATILENLTWLAVAQGRLHQAARLGAAAEALRGALGLPLHLDEQAAHDRAVLVLHDLLGAEAAALWRAATATPVEAAIALALEADGAPTP